MSHAGCGSSGLITADTLVHSGRCKLVSIHGYNAHNTDETTIIVYDNVAASGKIVAKLILPGKRSIVLDDTSGGDQAATGYTLTNIEYDMHAVLCDNGLYVDVTGGTPNMTVEYA